MEVSVLDRPAVDERNDHYVSNRPPLQPSRFIKLPVGAVQPGGWLREAMDRQRVGLTGQLGEISAWLQKEDNAWLSEDGQGEWGWEEVPYWLKGYANIGYIFNDEAMIAESMTWIEGALNSQREDGNFGPARFFGDDGSQDFWANMVMLHCLQSYYEYTGDERVIELMTRYFRYQFTVPDELMLTHYWQRMRGGDNIYAIYWLYNRTGDEFLLELADKIYRNTADWAMEDDLPNWHNVNIAQGFRLPAQYWQQTGEARLLQAAYNSFAEIRERYGQVPGGMFGADENARPGYDDPRQAIETCGIVEQMFSNQIMLRITGDPFWADHCEEVAFNTAPQSYLPDYRGLRYFVSPNGVTCDRHNHAPGIQNFGPFTIMSAVSNRCCQHNHSHGWPYLAENLWLATPDNGLCAAMYCASTVTATVGEGQEVTIAQDTRYPFSDTVRLSLSLSEDATFPLYLRIPAWCDAPVLLINGEKTLDLGDAEAASGKFVRINRAWSDGDEVELRLPMEVELKQWEQNHDSVSVTRGPLTYSLKIGQDFVAIPGDQAAVHDALWRDDVDVVNEWPSFEVLPTTAWNYGLVLEDGRLPMIEVIEGAWPEDDYPFTAEQAPIRLLVQARRVPEWTLDRHGLAGVLQDSPAFTEELIEEVELIPMGSALLRISAFPVASDDPGAVRWEPSGPPALYRASASHCFGGDWTGAIADGQVPGDAEGVPRHTFWDRRGTTEWLQADFGTHRHISQTSVYWFDDRAVDGHCRVPQSWRLLYRDAEGEWRPVEGVQQYGVARDQFNTIRFDSIATTGLRIEVQLQNEFSAGCWEWRIPEDEHD